MTKSKHMGLFKERIFKVNTRYNILAAGVVSALIASPAMAQPGSATIIADNGALMVVESSPGNFSPISTSIGGNWPRTRNFKFNMPDDGIERCKLHIIAWGDGSRLQGLMAEIRGGNGTSYTGQNGSPLNQVKMSTVLRPGPSNSLLNPAQQSAIAAYASNPANAASIINSASAGGQQFMSPTFASGQSGWPNINLSGVQNSGQIRFVWNGNVSTLRDNSRNFRVVSMPCSTIATPPPPKPMKGDHFQCYDVSKAQALKPEEITLRDQFGRKQVVLGRPIIMCNPAVKTHRKQTFKVSRPERHLVCYDIAKQPRPRGSISVQTEDQFTRQKFAVTQARMVCVPAAKKRLDGRDEPLTDSYATPARRLRLKGKK